MAMVTKTIDLDSPFTEEEILLIKELLNKPVIYDDEVPELTDDQLAQFRRVNETLRQERRKQTVTLRLSPSTLNKAKALGKGYTSVLSRIIEKALNDVEFIKSCL